ncbi:hypothetical protein D3C81_1958100 [compost metagenome]
MISARKKPTRNCQRQPHTHSSFVLTLVLKFLGCIGPAPNIIPTSVTLWAAASPAGSALFILPVIRMYAFWTYSVFHAKVRIDDGFHG